MIFKNIYWCWHILLLLFSLPVYMFRFRLLLLFIIVHLMLKNFLAFVFILICLVAVCQLELKSWLIDWLIDWRIDFKQIVSTARIVCWAWSMYARRRSVRPSVLSGRRVCCCGLGGQEISIDCCTAGWSAVSSSRAAAATCGGRMRAMPRCQLM